MLNVLFRVIVEHERNSTATEGGKRNCTFPESKSTSRADRGVNLGKDKTRLKNGGDSGNTAPKPMGRREERRKLAYSVSISYVKYITSPILLHSPVLQEG